MAKVLSRLDILLFANTAQYRREMKDTKDSTRSMMQSMGEDAKKMAKVGTTAFVGLAAAGGAALTAMINDQVALGTEISRTATIANASVESLQKNAIAAKSVGVEMDKLGDIYKDTQDKIGDFLSSGGGAMADFFENIAPQVGVTAEEFRKLSGPDALQLYYDSLQQANLSQSETVFYMEAIASDAANLIPLLHDGGEGFDLWAKAAENAGAVMDEETIRATQELTTSTDLLKLSLDGAKNQIVREMLPTVSDMAAAFVTDANAKEVAKVAGEALTGGLKILAKTGLATAQVFEGLGVIVETTAGSFSQLFDGVDLTDNSIMLALKLAGNFQKAGRIIKDGDSEFQQLNRHYANLMAGVDAWGAGNATNPVVHKLTEIKTATNGLNHELGITGQQYQAQVEAAEEAAKAAKKLTESQARLVGIAGNSGIGTGSHVDIRYASGDPRYHQKPSQAHINRFEVNGKSLGSLTKTSDYNLHRKHPVKGTVQPHYGVDYDTDIGDKITTKVPVKDVKAWYDPKGGGYVTTVTFADGVKMNLLHQHKSSKNIKGGPSSGPYKTAYNEANNLLAAEQKKAEQLLKQQARLEEQQAKLRTNIRMEFASDIERIEYDLQTKIEKIQSAGFEDADAKAFIDDAKAQAENQIKQIQLARDAQMHQAKQYQLTEVEQIKARYELERREIELTVGFDEELRDAKIESLNAAEQAELTEVRNAYESEVNQLTNYGMSELERLRSYYDQQRAQINQRTDITEEQKALLRDNLSKSQIYDTDRYQDDLRTQFGSLQSELNGTSANYQIAQQYQARLDLIQDSLDAEVIAEEEAGKAKLEARKAFETAATQLTLTSAQNMVGGMADAFKTMLGEQNTAYKLMFAAQQTFVMASAGLNMYDAWGDMMAQGATMSEKLAGAATIASEFGRIISAASAIKLELPGFQSGGYTGGRAEDEVVGFVHGQEFVSNAPTTRKYRPELEAMQNGTYKRNTGDTHINVDVTVNGSGQGSVESNHQLGRQIGHGIEGSILKIIKREKEPGGLLYA